MCVAIAPECLGNGDRPRKPPHQKNDYLQYQSQHMGVLKLQPQKLGITDDVPTVPAKARSLGSGS